MSLAGCTNSGESGNNSSGGNSSGKNKKLKVGIKSEPWNLDPALYTDTGSRIISNVVYDNIVGIEPTEGPTPEVATKLAEPVGENGKKWNIKLKEGVKFHDGSEMTAEDVKYTFEWIGNPDNDAAALGYAPMLRKKNGVPLVEKKGKYEVRLNLTQPNSFWNDWMTRVIDGVVPKDSRGNVAEAKGPKGLGTNLTTDPIGTGPYKFREWKSGSHIIVDAFDDYYRNGKNTPPYVDSIEFKFIPEASTRLSQLRSKNVDMMNQVPPKDFESLKNQSDITGKSLSGNSTVLNYINQNPKAFGEKNPMSNVHNRRAFHYGIDAKSILKDVAQGEGVVQKGPWFPDSEWTSPKLRDKSMYDPEKAKSELEKGPNPDGFTIKYMTENISNRKQMATIIQNQLKDIGITVDVQSVEKSTLYSRLYGTSRWHVAGASWGQSIGQVFYWLYAGFATQRNHNNWHSKPEDGNLSNDAWEPNGPKPPEGKPREKFGTNPGSGHKWYKSKIQQAFATNDTKEQKEIAYTLQEYIVDNVIQSDLYYKSKLQGWRSSVEGYDMGRFITDYSTARLNK
ncbi:putative dipeptides/oligopeptides ABC transporter periplasmic substrate-binding protein [Halococcus thailandensis JCM 13552]|uniref:Putative dipeptides/oligopeptides ABC transporter periplasmic substrate-binding protein n=2 Tax=Halococcus thailandensis TaxID=335952 RepID=M0MVU1_9EURY|nr:putative dipeptides/oligopeptides ABC transporter periplasmic substrate-binding protein [Halococcus thailandensis JCM 13552]